MTASPLPPWNSSGVLDLGVHSTDLDGVRERFVLDAPHTEIREQLFKCLELYLQRVRTFVGPSRVWINGGFAMRKAQPPGDVDLVILPDNSAAIDNLEEQRFYDFLQYLTLQDVFVGSPVPVSLTRMQPVAGAIDAFIARPDDEDYWRKFWSRVKRNGVEVDESKGFAEVRI